MDAVKAGGFGPRELVVRINGIDTPWHSDDLTAAGQAAPDAILIPKISHPDQLERIGQRLLDLHANLRTRVWAMIELPVALFNILPLAAEAADSEARLAVFVMGTKTSPRRPAPASCRAAADGAVADAMRRRRAHLRHRHSGRRLQRHR